MAHRERSGRGRLTIGGAAIMATIALAAPLAPAQDAQNHGDALRKRALRLMSEVPLIDGHNDLPWQLRQRVNNQLERLDLNEDLTQLERPTHTDIPRLRAGRVGGQFWSVYIPISLTGGRPEDVQTVIEQIDVVHRMVARYPEHFEIALTADDVERVFASGKIASLIGMEGGHSIGNSLAALRATYDLGARYMTLTHSKNTFWADSCTDEEIHGGLSAFGEEVVREMNRLGMLVDLSHVTPKTMRDAMDVSVAPIIFSHSSTKALCDVPRNVPDDVLERLPEDGGVIMITFVPSFIDQEVADYASAAQEERQRLLSEHPTEPEAVTEGMRVWREANPAPRADLHDVADHIDHAVKIAGVDHVGIGSDYDGIRSTPDGLEDASTYPDLVVEMLRRGYSDEDVRKILGLNILRVMREVEGIAQEVRRQRPPSDATIEDLDGPIPERGARGRGE